MSFVVVQWFHYMPLPAESKNQSRETISKKANLFFILFHWLYKFKIDFNSSLYRIEWRGRDNGWNNRRRVGLCSIRQSRKNKDESSKRMFSSAWITFPFLSWCRPSGHNVRSALAAERTTVISRRMLLLLLAEQHEKEKATDGWMDGRTDGREEAER